ncbi:MAG: response regulator transcription factor [Dehalococcoidia bacterium]
MQTFKPFIYSTKYHSKLSGASSAIPTVRDGASVYLGIPHVFYDLPNVQLNFTHPRVYSLARPDGAGSGSSGEQSHSEHGTIRVLLADDSAFVLRSLSRLLTAASGIIVVGQATNGEEAVAKTLELQPDVAILDVRMPGPDGVEATHKIKEHMPDVGILVFSMFSENFERALEAGADAFLLKDVDSDVLISTVRRLAGRE